MLFFCSHRILILFTLGTQGHGKILNYTNSQYIPYPDGSVAIFEDYAYLTHVTNLTVYEDILVETENLITLFPETVVLKPIRADLDQIRRLMDSVRLHHRHARSLNFLGTALKVIAGTPDFDDFNEVKTKAEQLIESHERQIDINTAVQKRINELSSVINKLTNSAKKNEIHTGHLYEAIINRNRAIITDLNNLFYSIVLAKLNVLNPSILDDQEIHKLLFPNFNVTISDIISSSKLKVLQGNDLLYFIVKFPEVKEICKKIRTIPVVHNKKMIMLETEFFGDCNGVFKPLQRCTQTSASDICQLGKNNNCSHKLLHKYSAVCKTISAHHVEPIIELSDGTVLLNDDYFLVKDEETSPILIKGTYLLTFQDEINVNNTIYKNFKRNNMVSPAMPSSHNINFTGHVDHLSLQYLKELNLKNINHITSLRSTVKQGHFIWLLITIPLFLTGLIIIIILIRKPNKFTISIPFPSGNSSQTQDAQAGTA